MKGKGCSLMRERAPPAEGVGCVSCELQKGQEMRDPEDQIQGGRVKAKPGEVGSSQAMAVPEHCVKLFRFHWKNKRKLM